jgi:hypothetical protein
MIGHGVSLREVPEILTERYPTETTLSLAITNRSQNKGRARGAERHPIACGLAFPPHAILPFRGSVVFTGFSEFPWLVSSSSWAA